MKSSARLPRHDGQAPSAQGHRNLEGGHLGSGHPDSRGAARATPNRGQSPASTRSCGVRSCRVPLVINTVTDERSILTGLGDRAANPGDGLWSF